MDIDSIQGSHPQAHPANEGRIVDLWRWRYHGTEDNNSTAGQVVFFQRRNGLSEPKVDTNVRVVSLGDYMSSLRPKQIPKNMSMEDVPSVIQRELEAGLASGLLKALGPNLGRALLPAVGIGPVQSKAQELAGAIATRWIVSDDLSISETGDKAGFPISFLTLLAFSELNAKINGGELAGGVGDNDDDEEKKTKAAATEKEKDNVKRPALPGANLSAMDKMKLGEVVVGPSFVDEQSGQIFSSNEFVMEDHFDDTIRSMEDRLGGGHVDCETNESTELKMAKKDMMEDETDENAQSGGTEKNVASVSGYDPEDRSLGTPVPINPRLFPDLCLGYGDALSSHTKREVLKMRLLSIILNKLGANYDRRRNGDSNLFTVRMKASDDSPITTPCAFVQALMDSGHDVSVVPTSRLTTFGIGMCVKEEDGSYTHIPLGVFIESGYEDARGRMAPAMMPHSGLDMFISGPLAGKRADGTPSELHIQHFIGIEGFCGWKNHANPELPFNQVVPGGKRLSGSDAVRATRLAALYAIVLNGLATELNLPFGGYGATAVCNDSAAILQQLLYGENTIYPLTSIGKYMQRSKRYAQKFATDMQNNTDGMERERQDIHAIIKAMKALPNDINSSPANAAGAAKRLLHTLQPKTPFVLTKESKAVMEAIVQEEEAEES